MPEKNKGVVYVPSGEASPACRLLHNNTKKGKEVKGGSPQKAPHKENSLAFNANNITTTKIHD